MSVTQQPIIALNFILTSRVQKPLVAFNLSTLIHLKIS